MHEPLTPAQPRRVGERITLLLAGVIVGAGVVFGLSMVKVPGYLAQVKMGVGFAMPTTTPTVLAQPSPANQRNRPQPEPVAVESIPQLQASSTRAPQVVSKTDKPPTAQTSAGSNQLPPTIASRKVVQKFPAQAHKAQRAYVRHRSAVVSDNPY